MRNHVLANETVDSEQNDGFVLEVVPPGREFVIVSLVWLLTQVPLAVCEEIERMFYHHVELFWEGEWFPGVCGECKTSGPCCSAVGGYERSIDG